MIHFNKVMNIHAKFSRTFFKTTYTHTHSYYLVTQKVQMKKKKSTNENTVNPLSPQKW